jgi:phosphatidylglycerophosphate synthase
MWLTVANIFTLTRLALALPTALAIVRADWPLAAALFAFAVATDLFDGPVARRFGQQSALGGLLDHATDAIFVTTVLAALAAAGYVTWVLPVLVPAAFVQYMLDSSALRGRHLRANWLGRANGIGYFVISGAVLLHGALGPGFDLEPWASVGAWLLVATTLCSMLDRLRALRLASVVSRK